MRKPANNDRVLRRQPRFNVGDEHEASVRVIRRAGSYSTECTAELVDISTGGVKLRVPVCLTFEEELRLEIKIASLDLTFDVAAMVRHIRPADADHWIVGCLLDPTLPDEALSQLAVMSAVERRHWPRRPVTLDVLVRREITGEAFEGIILNLSTGGIRMLLPKLCEIGEKISIYTVDDESGEPLAQGSLRWQMDTPDGIAAGCTFNDRESYRVLRNLIDESEIENPTPLVESLPPRRQVGLVVAVLAMCLPPLLTFVLHPYRARALTEPRPLVEGEKLIDQVAAQTPPLDRADGQQANSQPTTQVPQPTESTESTESAETTPTALATPTTATELELAHDEGPTVTVPREELLPTDARDSAVDVPRVELVKPSHETLAPPALDLDPPTTAAVAADPLATAEARELSQQTPLETAEEPPSPLALEPANLPFESGPRIWTDHTGRHRVLAELKSVVGNRVKLLKENGRYSTVPLARLSAFDVVYVRRWQMFHASGMPPGN